MHYYCNCIFRHSSDPVDTRYCPYVPGDVLRQLSGHLRDAPKFQVRERLCGEAHGVACRLRHRQRYHCCLLCRRGVVAPAG